MENPVFAGILFRKKSGYRISGAGESGCRRNPVEVGPTPEEVPLRKVPGWEESLTEKKICDEEDSVGTEPRILPRKKSCYRRNSARGLFVLERDP